MPERKRVHIRQSIQAADEAAQQGVSGLAAQRNAESIAREMTTVTSIEGRTHLGMGHP